jgi:hypothetical protein
VIGGTYSDQIAGGEEDDRLLGGAGDDQQTGTRGGERDRAGAGHDWGHQDDGLRVSCRKPLAGVG